VNFSFHDQGVMWHFLRPRGLTKRSNRSMSAHSARFGMWHITLSEARERFRRDRDIEIREIRCNRDGVVTPQERRQLRNELMRLSNDVQRMMNSDRRGRR